MNEKPSTEKTGLRFDATVNAGHLLTFAGFIIMGLAGWGSLDKRVVVLEEARKTQAQIDQHQDANQQNTNNAVRDSLREIKDGINKLNDRLDNRGR